MLVASFVMEKNKRYSYDAGYKLKVIAYAEEHGNRAAEWHSAIHQRKKTICDWQTGKEKLKKITIFRDLSVRFYKIIFF